MTILLASFGAAITALLLSILVTIKRPLERPDRWLAWWLVAQAVFWGATLLAGSGITGGGVALAMIGQLALFSSGPAQFLYTAAALRARSGLAIPIAATALVTALLLVPVLSGMALEPLSGGIVINRAPRWLFAVPLACLLLGAAFPLGVLRLVADYECRAKAFVSNLTNADPGWLRTWALASIAVHALLLLAALASTFEVTSPEVAIWTGMALQVASIGFVAHRSLTRPGAFFVPVGAARQAVLSPDPAQARADAAALRRHFDTAKPHLSPDLTAQELADGLGWAPERLTAALRQNGATFFDAVNGRRVSELQAMLQDPANRQRSLLILAHDAGFGSKSALYAAFQRHAGCGPAQWRKRDAANRRFSAAAES